MSLGATGPETTPGRDAETGETARGAAGILRWMDHGLTAVAAVLLFALMVVTLIDVGGRYLLNRPLPGGFEITEVMLAALIFASLPPVEARDQHIVIDLLDGFYSERARRVRQIVVNFVSAAIVGLLAWRLGIKAARLSVDGETTAILTLPIAPFAYFMAAMCALAAMILVLKAGQLIHRGEQR